MNLVSMPGPDHPEFAQSLADDGWLIGCLCANWCDLCGTYRQTFADLASRHPDKHFVWIDIEDHADMVGEMDVENFPTLLIQRADLVVFFGAILPDLRVADRLLSSLAKETLAVLQAETESSATKRAWQSANNLRKSVR